MLLKHVFIIFIVIFLKIPFAFGEDIFGNLTVDEISSKKYVSIVFAANNLRSSSSIFGHTFLLFHNQVLPELDSIALEFLANSEDKSFSMTKAFIYQVNANYRIRYYLDKKTEYNNEDRDLFVYTLSLADSDKINLFNSVKTNVLKDFKYNFISSNCSYYIYKILSDAKITHEATPFLYTLPINTIRTLELNNQIVMNNVEYSSQTLFKHAYLELNEKEKAHVDSILKLKDSNLENLNINERKAIYLGVDYLVLHEADVFKRYELLTLKRNVGDIKFTIRSIVDENPIRKRGETSISIAQNLHSKGQSIELKPGLRDFKSNYDDGLSTSYFEILKLNIVKNSRNIFLNKLTILKVNNFIPENVYKKPLDSYLELGWLKKINSDYYLNFGYGKSFKLLNIDIGIKPLFSLRTNNSISFKLGSIFNMQFPIFRNIFFISEIKYIGKELEIENHLTYSLSSNYRLFLTHLKINKKEKLDIGINYLF